MIAAGELPVPTDLAWQVDDGEYARLLDYPHRRIPDGRARRRADESRAWYAGNGRPWAFASTVAIASVAGAEIRLASGERLDSEVLAQRFAAGGARGLVAAAVSAGPEVDGQSGLHWQEGRPDEGYFLDRFAAAVVEHLAGWAGSHLRQLAAAAGLGLLPSYSPGYQGWDLEQQTRVAGCLSAGSAGAPPRRCFEVLASGMIRPKSSLLAVFGLTPDRDAADQAWRRQACSWCSLTDCGFRRVRVAASQTRDPTGRP